MWQTSLLPYLDGPSRQGAQEMVAIDPSLGQHLPAPCWDWRGMLSQVARQGFLGKQMPLCPSAVFLLCNEMLIGQRIQVLSIRGRKTLGWWWVGVGSVPSRVHPLELPPPDTLPHRPPACSSSALQLTELITAWE